MIATLNKFKREYFDWRTWDYFYKNMKNDRYLTTHTGTSNVPYLKTPGIAFSFDDSFRIKDWYKYGKDLFGFYDVKVTFNINALHHYEGNREHTQDEIDMLLDLQANGHELAHHGYNHRDVIKYSEEVGLNKWIEDEIEILFEWMEKQTHSRTGEKFKRPVTFAFPYFKYNEETIKTLVPKYFKVARGLFSMDRFLTPNNHTGFAPSLCIDSHYLANPKNITKVMKLVKETGCNLILTCHSILPDDVDWDEFGWPMEEHSGRWRSSPKIIQSIINEARKNGLAFYTTAELAGVATFIDRNFECYVRSLLNKDLEQWILISDLDSIKELDLSNQNVSNLDGIQYFLGLEKLNLSNNNISDTRLLKELPNLVDVKFDN